MTPATSPPGDRRPLAVLFDWGGVLTPPLGALMAAWLASEGIDGQHFSAVMGAWSGPFAEPAAASRSGPATDPRPPDSPIHALERGEISPATFEASLAGALVELGSTVRSQGLLQRMLGGVSLDDEMIGLVREVRARGALTGMLSNSWGDHYPDVLFDGLFDDVVISGREGLRKPEPAIFVLAAQRLGVGPAQCLFVDDLPVNVAGARAVGMAAILHTGPAETSTALLAALSASHPGQRRP